MGSAPIRETCGFLHPLVFICFRTLVRDRNALNPFRFNRLRTTFFATEGWGMISALIPRPQPLAPVSSFQQLTTVKFCNSFILITIQIARGGGSPLPVQRLKFYLKPWIIRRAMVILSEPKDLSEDAWACPELLTLNR